MNKQPVDRRDAIQWAWRLFLGTDPDDATVARIEAANPQGMIGLRTLFLQSPAVQRQTPWLAELVELRALVEAAQAGPVRIIVGSAGTSQPGWLATNRGILDLLRPEQWDFFFARHGLQALLAEHVFEHLTAADLDRALSHVAAVLRPGGWIRCAVPDGYFPDPDYIAQVRPGGSGPGADDHKVLWTHETLAPLFARHGLAVRLLEYHDAQGALHVQPWDPGQGMIRRSVRFDPRNTDGTIRYASLILDAVKP